MTNPLEDYRTNGAWDELIDSEGQPRPHARHLMQYLSSLDDKELLSRKVASEIAIREMGISFTVYIKVRLGIGLHIPVNIRPGSDHRIVIIRAVVTVILHTIVIVVV